MNFETAAKVQQTIRAGEQVERIRGENRNKVNALANGAPPLDSVAAAKMNMRINVNWGEGPVLFAHARRQYEDAILGTQNFFKVRLPSAPVEKAASWSMTITNAINRPMKKSQTYAWVQQNRFSSVVLHGPGIQTWYDAESWCPSLVAVEDFRVPTDTTTCLKNDGWFAIRKQYTPGELIKRVYGDNASKFWNKKIVGAILDNYKEVNFEQTTYSWLNNPEKLLELSKQNLGYLSSDAMPSISLWHFFFYDDEGKKPGWKMRVVSEAGRNKGPKEDDKDFLYDSKNKIHAEDIEQIIAVQFGDLNNKPPFMYHSVRSLGFLLMEPCFWTNLARCRYLQHVWENFNTWFRSVDPTDRQRTMKLELFDRAIIPPGLSVIPANERHTIDPQMVESMLAQLKQLMGEASSSYTQQSDTGTQKEQTAFETQVKVSMVNAMLSALLKRAFRTETYSYREICRRFCLSSTEDKDARAFQKECKKAGVPREYLNVNLWEVEPEIPLGSGNSTMAQAQAQGLMGVRPMLNPTAQQEVLHDLVETITNDPRKAERLVPLDGKQNVTDAQRDAEFAFGSLMQAVPIRLKEGLSPIEQCETLLGLMAGKIAHYESTSNMASSEAIDGLENVGAYIEAQIQQLAQDESQKDLVKQYSDVLGKLLNSVKAFSQRLAAQNGKNNSGVLESLGMTYGAPPESIKRQMEAMAGFQPATEPVTDPKIVKAVHSMSIKTAQAHQQAVNKEADFKLEQRRKDEEALAEVHRKDALALTEAARKPEPVDSNGNGS